MHIHNIAVSHQDKYSGDYKWISEHFLNQLMPILHI